MMHDVKIIRAVTVDSSLGFVEPMLNELTQKYDVQLLSTPGERLDRLSDEYNLIKHPVPMSRHISILQDLKSLVALIKVFHREKPTMVHSMTPKAGLLCMLAAKLCNVPCRIHTFTGLVWPIKTGMIRRVLMMTDWLTCSCATHIIPEGQGVLDDLSKHITKKPMKVLGYGNVRGIDLTRFGLRPEISENAKRLKKVDIFTFIFVGRLVGDKGINELIEAFERLKVKYEKIRLLLVGKFEAELDPLKSETLEKIDNNASIEATGPQYGDDLVSLYAASDCFVFPSYREGFPNTVLEAGAMGLPSIVTDINGSREIIEDGVNGLIIPSKDANALYRAMEQILVDREKTKEYAQNARPLIASRFEQEFVKKCLLDFYDEILFEQK